MRFLDRVRLGWKAARAIEGSVGANSIPFTNDWKRTSWLEPTFDRLVRDGYNANAAVGACIRVLAFAFGEPRPMTVDPDGERVPRHPLQALLDRPNSIMSHSEMLSTIGVYLGIGGNCYLHKVRNRSRQVIALWPYSAGQMSPIPSATEWVSDYEYDAGSGNKIIIPADDIVHLKWPLPDLEQPWLALPPLRQVAREVDTDAEMTRMLHMFLVNDVTPPTIINLPAGTNLTQTEYEMLISRFMARHGGRNRGVPAVIEGASDITRLNLNLRDLDLTALRGVPEARICAAFGVPPEVAGLSVGMAHSTENNLAAADVRFTTRTLVPLWKGVAGELTQDLGPEFAGDVRVEYDLSGVQALQENEAERWARALDGWDRNTLTLNETRAYIGYGPIGKLVASDPGDVFADGSIPGEQSQPRPIIDVTPVPAQLTGDAKRRREAKARKDTATTRIEKQIQRKVSGYFEEQGVKVLAEVGGE